MLGVGNKFPSFELPSCNADNSLGTTKFSDEYRGENFAKVFPEFYEIIKDEWQRI